MVRDFAPKLYAVRKSRASGGKLPHLFFSGKAWTRSSAPSVGVFRVAPQGRLGRLYPAILYSGNLVECGKQGVPGETRASTRALAAW